MCVSSCLEGAGRTRLQEGESLCPPGGISLKPPCLQVELHADSVFSSQHASQDCSKTGDMAGLLQSGKGASSKPARSCTARLGSVEMTQTKNGHKLFLDKLFEHHQGSGTSRQKSRDIPDSSLRNPLSREGTNFSTPTPSGERPPPHPAVSGPKRLVFVLFFLA